MPALKNVTLANYFDSDEDHMRRMGTSLLFSLPPPRKSEI